MRNSIEIEAPEVPAIIDPTLGDKLILIRLVASKEAALFAIPVHDIHDATGVQVVLKDDQQRKMFERWEEVFTYAGAEVTHGGDEANVMIDPPRSWHETIFQGFRQKIQTAKPDDAIWSKYGSVSVELIESFSHRTLDSFFERPFADAHFMEGLL